MLQLSRSIFVFICLFASSCQTQRPCIPQDNCPERQIADHLASIKEWHDVEVVNGSADGAVPPQPRDAVDGLVGLGYYITFRIFGIPANADMQLIRQVKLPAAPDNFLIFLDNKQRWD